jgi:ATP-binding cassette subfamily B protein
VIIVSLVVSKMIPTFRQMQERVDNINRVLREQITGIRVIRAFVREPDEAARFGGANDELTATSLTAGHLMALMFPSIMIVLNLSTVAAVWVGADRVHERAMQVGALIAFLSYLAQILMSVMMASFMAIMIPRAAVCAERIMEVLNTPSSIVTQTTPVAAPQHTSTLELREVGFAYPGAEAPVLHDISFTLHRGETLAIIGSTGSGKTTLLNVIPRLIDVTSGAVLLDGIDIREIQTESLWNHIGLVPQRPFLFSGTVASNLRFSAPNATDEELWEALRIAQAEDFVRAMPGGLDEPIHQGGTNVSGGQRQRLAIARALVRKPQIFLFDDSFSALDLATDARLRAALEPQLEESIAIIVAQRVSTIATADHILVLEDGAVVGLDTHEQLLEHCPTYQEIVASQAAVEAAA